MLEPKCLLGRLLGGERRLSREGSGGNFGPDLPISAAVVVPGSVEPSVATLAVARMLSI